MTGPQTTLGPLWRPRYWAARKLITAGFWIMPRSRYKTELNALFWTLGLKVQAHNAALRHASLQEPHDA